MSRSTVKYMAAGLILLSAVTYLAFAGMKDGWVSYHLPVDEFFTNPQYQSQRVRLAGKVADEGAVIGQGRLNAEFRLSGQTRQIPVTYKGIVPDLFKPGCEVIVEGRLDKSGQFRADVLMTKCASKYDSAKHATRTEKAL